MLSDWKIKSRNSGWFQWLPRLVRRFSFLLLLKLRQNDPTFERNISQHRWAQYVGRVWSHCCDKLGIENRTSVSRRNIVARTWPNGYNIMQHPRTNVAWKIWLLSNIKRNMCVILKYLVYFVPSECRSVNFRFRLAWIICCIIPHVTGSVKLLFPPTTFIFVYNSTLILFWPWHFLNFSSCVQHVYSQLRRFFCHVTVTNVSLRRRPLLGTVSWDSRHFETVL